MIQLHPLATDKVSHSHGHSVDVGLSGVTFRIFKPIHREGLLCVESTT